MLKVLVLQNINDLSDEALEAALHDRISFRNFIGFDSAIPDARSIWVFRERLAENKLYESVWNELISFLEADDFFDGSAMIQDSTTICTSEGKKRTGLERIAEKQGHAVIYTKKQRAHIDNYSTWTCKNGQYSHGIKYHLLVDAVSKGIIDYKVTTASLHDSQIMLAKDGEYSLFLDKGYVGCKNLPEGVTPYIPNKMYGDREPGPEEQMLNKLMSGIRCRIEHVNGFIKNVLHGEQSRYKRNPRMEVACMFKCMIYNMFRYEFLKRKTV
jgi:IS5 family transposase